MAGDFCPHVVGEVGWKLRDTRQNEHLLWSSNGHVEDPTLLLELCFLFVKGLSVIDRRKETIHAPSNDNEVCREALGLVKTHDSDIVDISRKFRLRNARTENITKAWRVDFALDCDGLRVGTEGLRPLRILREEFGDKGIANEAAECAQSSFQLLEPVDRRLGVRKTLLSRGESRQKFARGLTRLGAPVSDSLPWSSPEGIAAEYTPTAKRGAVVRVCEKTKQDEGLLRLRFTLLLRVARERLLREEAMGRNPQRVEVVANGIAELASGRENEDLPGLYLAGLNAALDEVR